ncbi:MAG: 30S ribosomal protein S4, partial [Verrucomicrobiota bacterium]
MTLKAGDVVVVKDNKKSRDMAGLYVDAAESRGIVPWLKLDKTAFKGEVDHVPSREEINPTVNEQLVVELYSK